jgi:hypothetical protein
VALCAPLVENEARVELAEVLGADPMEAAQFAAELLTGRGCGWRLRSRPGDGAVARWVAAWGHQRRYPTQEAIDTWANERILGLIDRFPIQIDPGLACLLATALATKVS